MKRIITLILFTCVLMVANPPKSHAFFFDAALGAFGKFIDKAEVAIAKAQAFIQTSIAVKEYTEEQMLIASMLGDFESAIIKNLPYLNSNESKILREVKKAIEKDLKDSELKDLNFLTTIAGSIGSGEAATSLIGINDYAENALTNIRGLRFDIMSFIDYTNCIVQKKRVRLGLIKYDYYRLQTIDRYTQALNNFKK